MGMQAIRTATDITSLGTILGVWAHPDDETWTSAGIMIAAVRNGQKVICVTATRGEAGVQNKEKWPVKKLGTIRKKELEQSLYIIGDGVIEHTWLSYRDGHCKEESVRIGARHIAALIEEYQPDTILTFGRDGLTGHADHQAMSVWVDEALQQIAVQPRSVFHACESRAQYKAYGKQLDTAFDIYFNTDTPPVCPESDLDICFSLPKDILDKKMNALKAHTSQTSKIFSNKKAEQLLRGLVQKECFKRVERTNI